MTDDDTSSLGPEDWQTVAVAVRARRSRQQLTQQQLADRAGLGVQTIRNIEAAKPVDSRRPATLHAIEDVLGWPHGLIQFISSGETPIGAELEGRIRIIESELPLLQRRVDRLVNHLGHVANFVDPEDEPF